jgi:hypothetical protein
MQAAHGGDQNTVERGQESQITSPQRHRGRRDYAEKTLREFSPRLCVSAVNKSYFFFP